MVIRSVRKHKRYDKGSKTHKMQFGVFNKTLLFSVQGNINHDNSSSYISMKWKGTIEA